MPDLEDLESLIVTGTPVIFVETADAGRLEDLCRRLGTRCGKPLYRWALATGLARSDGGAVMLGPGSQPAQILSQVLSLPDPALFLLLDLVRYLEEPLIISQLREIAARYERVPHTLIVPGSSLQIPADLRSLAARIDLALPTIAELEALIRAEAEAWGRSHDRRVQATQAAIAALARNLAGLSHADARRLVRNA